MSLYPDHVSLFDESACRVMQDLPQTPQPRKAELRGRDPTQIGAVFGRRGVDRYQPTEHERFPHIAVKKHVDRVLGPEQFAVTSQVEAVVGNALFQEGNAR